MQDYQKRFLDYVIEKDILRFGEFTLKSGRKSPYFFNAGLFNTGQALGFIGQCYASAIVASGLQFDVLFGPAYKGIPLASSTAIALNDCFQRETPYSFNRKEAKDHGEGGSIVGAALEKDILVIDDVITAGTAIREVMTLIKATPGADPAGVIVALDRQEKGRGELSAIQEVEQEFEIPVVSIINLSQIVAYLEEQDSQQLKDFLPKLKEYQRNYGV